MKVTDLNPTQLSNAKAQMVVDSLNNKEGRFEYGDEAFPDDVITDEEAYEYYAGTEFDYEDIADGSTPSLTIRQSILLSEIAIKFRQLEDEGVSLILPFGTNTIYAVNTNECELTIDNWKHQMIDYERDGEKVCEIDFAPDCENDVICIENY